MANEFIIRKGFKSQEDSEISGSLNISGSIYVSNPNSQLTGSFTGSFTGDGSGLIGVDSGSWDGVYSGSAEITGSLRITGSLDTTGAATFSGATVTIGSAVAATNVKLLLNGVASKAAGIEFQQSGTSQWYIGNGIASEDNNFELYNSNGTMAMKIIKSTNAINFTGAATFNTTNTFPITIQTTTGNNGIKILTSATTTSWLLGAQYNVNNAFEITPSTVVGGSTFSTPALTISSGGDVGIGVTPSAWQTTLGSNALQFLGGYIYNYRDTNLISGNNAYYDGAWKYYKGSIGATKFNSGNGTFGFAVASSGNVNDEITWTDALAISSTGATAIRMNPTSTQASLTLERISTDVAADDTIGYLNFLSNDSSTSSTGGVGGIAVKAEAAFNTSHTPSYMSFYTHATTSNDGTNIGNVTEAMRILSNGNVGIGTGAPDMNGWGANHTILGISTPTAGKSSQLNLRGNSDETADVMVGTIGFLDSSGTGAGATAANIIVKSATATATRPGSYMGFYTNDGSSAVTPAQERMRISSGGNVGIGTLSTSANSLQKYLSITDNYNVGIILNDTRGSNAFEIFNAGEVFNIAYGSSAKLTITSTGAATFSGALSGTSATFSSTITATQGISSLNGNNSFQAGIAGLNIPVFQSGLTTSYPQFTINTFNGTSGAAYIGWNIKSATNASDSSAYMLSNYATKITGDDGTFHFYTAPSGTAGNTVSFTDRLTIANTGAATFSGVINADAGIIIGGNTGLTSNNWGSGKNSKFLSSHASQPQGILIHYTDASPNSTGNLFIECHDNDDQRFTVRSNGGVANYSGNNVNLSDESVKKNITDTPDSLDIIKNLEVKDFQYIDQTDDKIHTGVIAQQVLKTDPSLVDQSGELKMVYNTDLMFKMLKAIQEQQTIIEDLKSRIETLEG